MSKPPLFTTQTNPGTPKAALDILNIPATPATSIPTGLTGSSPARTELDVVDDSAPSKDSGLAGARATGGQLEAAGAGAEFGSESQQEVVDVGVLIRRKGLREKAVAELESMLVAKRFLWDPTLNDGKGGHREESDYPTRMKAIEQIFNRTDGMPAQRQEILQAIMKLGGAKKDGDGKVRLTPATAREMKRMLEEFDATEVEGVSKKTGGGPPQGGRGR